MNKEQYFTELENIKLQMRKCMQKMQDAENNEEWQKYNDLHYDLLQEKKALIRQRTLTFRSSK